VSQAGVLDLVRPDASDLGGGAVAELLGGSSREVPDRYAVASPASLLPLGVPVLLVHGNRDVDVPSTHSRDYAEAARRVGDPVELVELDGADHFDLIETTHEAWSIVCRWLERTAG
jgi:pimeloyl-ACP methyl ester carboxylesterase